MQLNYIKSNTILLLISIIVSYLYVFVIDWTLIKTAGFSDFFNYLERIIYLEKGGLERSSSGLSILFSEFIWKYVLLFTSSIFSKPETALYFISALSFSIYFYFTIKRVNFFIVLILLINPMFIDLIMGQIRIALAFSLLLIAYELKERMKYISISLLLITPMIHTSMFLIILIYFVLSFIINLKMHLRKRYILVFLTAFIIAFFLKFGADSILVSVGDKRANYSEVIQASSIKYSLFWFILSIILFLYVKPKNKNENLIVVFSITMICLFFFSSLINAYGQRYLAIAIPLVIISVNYLENKQKYITFFLITIYQGLQYLYWTKSIQFL